LQLANLIAALAGQEEQAHRAAKVIIAKGAPQRPQFFRREHAFPRSAHIRLGCASNRIRIE
jgi:hypothetical protein